MRTVLTVILVLAFIAALAMVFDLPQLIQSAIDLTQAVNGGGSARL